MTLTELRYIVALAREKHFGRAAEACFVSQPTLSVAAKKLEKELGVALFERGKTEVAVTPIGERIVEQVRRLLEQLEGVRRIAIRAYVRIVVEVLTGIGLHRVGSPLVADWLEGMFEVAARNPDCAMLASRQSQHEHRNLLDGACGVFHVSGAHWRRGHGRLDKGQFM
jgi:LysR family hydrogen peroxide-inducible transcriptional activator